MYSFLLIIEKERSELRLMEGETVKAKKEWAEAKDMGRQLFQAIDSLLQSHGLGPTDIANFRLETAISDNFTSVKIAQTVSQMYNWAVSENKG